MTLCYPEKYAPRVDQKAWHFAVAAEASKERRSRAMPSKYVALKHSLLLVHGPGNERRIPLLPLPFHAQWSPWQDGNDCSRPLLTAA